MIKEKEKESSNESKSKRLKRVKIIRSDDVCVWDRYFYTTAIFFLDFLFRYSNYTYKAIRHTRNS